MIIACTSCGLVSYITCSYDASMCFIIVLLFAYFVTVAPFVFLILADACSCLQSIEVISNCLKVLFDHREREREL